MSNDKVRVGLYVPTVAVLLVFAFAGHCLSQANPMDQALLDACEKGNEFEIARLLDEGANPRAKDKTGVTALMWAAGWVKTAAPSPQVISTGFTQTTFGPDGKIETVTRGDARGFPAAVKSLLEKGADVNSKDQFGATALMVACGYVRPPKNMKPDTPVFSPSANYEIARLLLEKGAEVNTKDKDGVTALMSACGFIFMTEVRDKDQKTMTMRCRAGYPEVVKLLLEFKADANAKNRMGLTTVHIACIQDEQDLLFRTITTGDAGTEAPQSLPRSEILEMLLEHKAGVDVKDWWGATPLDWAAYNGRLDRVKALVEKGANIHSQNTAGLSPLMKAAWKGQLPVVSYLLEKGARINTKAKNGETALTVAALNGHKDVVRLLAEKGADIQAKDSSGRTALKCAQQKKHKEVEEILRKAAETRGSAPQGKDVSKRR